MKKIIANYAFAVICIGIAIYFLVRAEYIALLQQISLLDLIVAMAISFISASFGGLTFSYLIKKQHHVLLSLKDIFTLRFMMLLWGVIIPLKGGMLFSIFFLKSKYQIRATGGTSINLFIYMVSFIIMGITGLYYSLFKGTLFSLLTITSIIFIFNPLILNGTKHLLRRIPQPSNKTASRLYVLIMSTLKDSNQLGNDFYALSTVGGLTLLKYFFRTLRYWWAASVFGLEIPLFSLIALTLIIELLNTVFRISPGNLGVQELISGGVFSIMGDPTEEGILIALFCRFTNLFLAFTIGLWATRTNMKYFHATNLKSLWSKVKIT